MYGLPTVGNIAKRIMADIKEMMLMKVE